MTISDERKQIRSLREVAGILGEKTLTMIARQYWQRSDIVLVLVLLAFAAVVTAITQLRPVYNWDVLAYLAASLRDGFQTNAELHAHVFDIVKASAPAADFTELTQIDAYRLRQFTDPDAFVSMLGMYEVKWLFVGLLKVLIPVVGPLQAFNVINGIALAILTVSLFLWMRAVKLSGYAPVAVCFLFLLQFQGFAVTQQPDFLGNALMLAAIFALERKRDVLGSFLVILTVLTRPDQLAIVGVLMACAWFLRDRASALFVLTFLASLATYVLVSRSGNSVGWWPHFWFSTWQIQETMVDFKPAFSLDVYFSSLALNLYRSMFQNTWLAAYGLAFAWALRLYWSNAVSDPRRSALLLCLILAVPAKFLVFPLHDGRIYFVPLFAFFMIALAVHANSAKSGLVKHT